MYGFFRKVFSFLAVLCCSCALIVNFFPLDSSAADVVTQDTSQISDVPMETLASADPRQDPIQITIESPSNGELVLTNQDTYITTISANQANGFKAVVLGLFGDYEMITKEYTYTGTNGYTTKQVTTESDYPWMISAGIFSIVLYCLFRMVGGVLCGRK